MPVESATGEHPTHRPAPDAQPRPAWILALACVPGLVVAALLRWWALRTAPVFFNSDEAMTGLQALEVLDGRGRLVAAGQDYLGTTESYLVAPLLLLWEGVGPLRGVAVAITVVAAAALAWAIRPVLGVALSLTAGLVVLVSSGAGVVLGIRSYMGMPSGVLAMVVALGLASRSMSTVTPARAVAAGFATGFAMWSHPMFGLVAALGLLAPTVVHRRRLREWWVPAAAGGVVGVSPWLVHMAKEGLPVAPDAWRELSYPGRIWVFLHELLPRGLGLRTGRGEWIGPDLVSQSLAVLLVAGALGGLVLLVAVRGPAALPFAVAGWAAFPALALLRGLVYVDDARYAAPFVPLVVTGLVAWLLLAPEPWSRSPLVPAVVPVVWALVTCVPVLRADLGTDFVDPDLRAREAVELLEQRGVEAVRGDYWGVYVLDYLARGELGALPDYFVRFPDDAAGVEELPPERVAIVHPTSRAALGELPLPLPLDRYDVVPLGPTPFGRNDLLVPR